MPDCLWTFPKVKKSLSAESESEILSYHGWRPSPSAQAMHAYIFEHEDHGTFSYLYVDGKRGQDLVGRHDGNPLYVGAHSLMPVGMRRLVCRTRPRRQMAEGQLRRLDSRRKALHRDKAFLAREFARWGYMQGRGVHADESFQEWLDRKGVKISDYEAYAWDLPAPTPYRGQKWILENEKWVKA